MADGSNGHVTNGDVAAQLAMMQKLMADQAAQLEAQRKELEAERRERAKREEGLKAQFMRSNQQPESGIHSGQMSSVQSSFTADAELDALRRQLEERERELKQKDEQLKERDDRLSLMTHR